MNSDRVRFSFFIHFSFAAFILISIGIASARHLPDLPFLLIAAALISALGIFRRHNEIISITCLLILCALTGAISIKSDSRDTDYEVFSSRIKELSETVQITGRISDIRKESSDQSRKSFYGTLSRARIKGEAGIRIPGRLKVSGRSEIPLENGQIITVNTKLRQLKNPTNFYEIAEHDRMYRAGFTGIAYRAEVVRVDHPPGFVAAIRNRIEDRIDSGLTARSASVVKALFLGVRSGMDFQTRKKIADTGLLHLFAISGLHVAILAGLILLFMRGLFSGWKMRYAAACGLLVFYGFMVGWKASVTRAIVVFLFYSVIRFTVRTPSFLNMTSLAGILILIIDPNQLMTPGFQLSFSAVFGLILWTRYLISEKERLKGARKVLNIMMWTGATSCVAWSATAPVIQYWFGQCNALGPVWNVAAIPIGTALTVLSAIYSLTSCILPPHLNIVSYPTEILTAGFLNYVNSINQVPLGVVFSPRWPLELVLGYYAAAFVVVMTGLVKTAWIRWAVLMCFSVSFILISSCWPYLSSGGSRLHFYDAGQADCILLVTEKGRTLLIDTGKAFNPNTVRNVIRPSLKRMGIRSLDAVMITHPQFDHAGGSEELLNSIEVRHFITNGDSSRSEFWKSLKASLNESRTQTHVISQGDVIYGFDGMQIRILHPSKHFDGSLNDRSVVCAIRSNSREVLLTGDIGEKGIERLLEVGQLSEVDVLKYPHHGAKLLEFGQALLYRISPDVVVMSLAKKNRYGHPDQSSLEFVKKQGIKIFRTDQNGEIIYDFKTGEITSKS